MSKREYTEALQAEQAGSWDKAHRIVQKIDTPEAAWIHAYLHRVEGNPENAAYWYQRAGRPECTSSLEQEWQELFYALSR
jgi:hypothetical protein